MSQRDILSVRLGDLAAQWKAFCRETGVTPSEGIRQLLRKLLQKSGAREKRFQASREVHDKRRHRVYLRLTEPEYEALCAIAAAEGFKPTRWLVAMLRHRLTGQPQLGQEEMAALKESNRILAGMARNLNQATRAVRQGLKTDRPIKASRLVVLDSVPAAIKKQGEVTRSVLRANEARWRR